MSEKKLRVRKKAIKFFEQNADKGNVLFVFLKRKGSEVWEPVFRQFPTLFAFRTWVRRHEDTDMIEQVQFFSVPAGADMYRLQQLANKMAGITQTHSVN